MPRAPFFGVALACLCSCAVPGKGEGGDAPPGHAGRRLDDPRGEEVERYLREYGYDPADFRAAPDRWRAGLPGWQRADAPPGGVDSPYMRGSALDPYRQNVLKGDYPILGQHVFFVFTAVSDTIVEARDLPTPSSISTAGPGRAAFFGSGRQAFVSSNLALSLELFSGNAAFKPVDWLVRITPVFNASFLDVRENNAVSIDVREGTTREDGHVGLQEAFVEKHLADLSDNYDFLSLTVGIQPFVADFRGFLFSDNNLGARLTANWDNNRTQANLALFYPLEKDTNSELNEFETRDQLILVASLFRQDFVWLGYTARLTFAWNHDLGSAREDANHVPVRPAILGEARTAGLDVVYLGWAGDGHIGRLNLTHEAYLALGRDEFNQITGRPVDIAAFLAFLELSVDFDWLRVRGSLLWLSGDDDPFDGTAQGFDGILDNPNFAGGANSFWIRQGIRLLGVGLVQRLSAFPSLRSSKLEGRANFVNPGLLFLTAGLDAEVTQELRASLNVSYLFFADPELLGPFLHQDGIGRDVGGEVTLSLQARPFLTSNVQLAGGLSLFFPGEDFGRIYESRSLLVSLFLQMTLVF